MTCDSQMSTTSCIPKNRHESRGSHPALQQPPQHSTTQASPSLSPSPRLSCAIKLSLAPSLAAQCRRGSTPGRRGARSGGRRRPAPGRGCCRYARTAACACPARSACVCMEQSMAGMPTWQCKASRGSKEGGRASRLQPPPAPPTAAPRPLPPATHLSHAVGLPHREVPHLPHEVVRVVEPRDVLRRGARGTGGRVGG